MNNKIKQRITFAQHLTTCHVVPGDVSYRAAAFHWVHAAFGLVFPVFEAALVHVIKGVREEPGSGEPIAYTPIGFTAEYRQTLEHKEPRSISANRPVHQLTAWLRTVLQFELHSRCCLGRTAYMYTGRGGTSKDARTKEICHYELKGVKLQVKGPKRRVGKASN